MDPRNVRKIRKAANSAKSDLEEVDNIHCCFGAWYQRNVSLPQIRKEHPKGKDHKKHQRRLKALAKRRHSRAQRRLGKLQCAQG